MEVVHHTVGALCNSSYLKNWNLLFILHTSADYTAKAEGFMDLGIQWTFEAFLCITSVVIITIIIILIIYL